MSLLEARGLGKRYGPVVALESADLSVDAGEVHALLGANGAGKSTLVKILTGVIERDGGSVELRGKRVRVSSPSQAARIGLAPVFQDPALVPDLTVAQNIRLTGVDVDAVRQRLREMDVDVDFTEQAGDLPLPLLRMIDLALAAFTRHEGSDIAAVAKHGRAIAHGDHLGEPMRDEEDRPALAAPLLHHGKDALREIGWQRRGDLVEQQKLWVASQRAIVTFCWLPPERRRT